MLSVLDSLGYSLSDAEIVFCPFPNALFSKSEEEPLSLSLSLEGSMHTQSHLLPPPSLAAAPATPPGAHTHCQHSHISIVVVVVQGKEATGAIAPLPIPWGEI